MPALVGPNGAPLWRPFRSLEDLTARQPLGPDIEHANSWDAERIALERYGAPVVLGIVCVLRLDTGPSDTEPLAPWERASHWTP